jgi:hypothetical protein
MLDHVRGDLRGTCMADEGARQLLDMVGECIGKWDMTGIRGNDRSPIETVCQHLENIAELRLFGEKYRNFRTEHGPSLDSRIIYRCGEGAFGLMGHSSRVYLS